MASVCVHDCYQSADLRLRLSGRQSTNAVSRGLQLNPAVVGSLSCGIAAESRDKSRIPLLNCALRSVEIFAVPATQHRLIARYPWCMLVGYIACEQSRRRRASGGSHSRADPTLLCIGSHSASWHRNQHLAAHLSPRRANAAPGQVSVLQGELTAGGMTPRASETQVGFPRGMSPFQDSMPRSPCTTLANGIIRGHKSTATWCKASSCADGGDTAGSVQPCLFAI